MARRKAEGAGVSAIQIFGLIVVIVSVYGLVAFLPATRSMHGVIETASCEKGDHEACSGRVFDRGHRIPCGCVHHAGLCPVCQGTGRFG